MGTENPHHRLQHQTIQIRRSTKMKQNDVNYVETVGRVKSVFFPKEKRCLIRLQVGYNMPEFFCVDDTAEYVKNNIQSGDFVKIIANIQSSYINKLHKNVSTLFVNRIIKLSDTYSITNSFKTQRKYKILCQS